MQTGLTNSPRARAEAVGLPWAPPAVVEEELIDSMLLDLWRSNPAESVADAVKKLYAERHGLDLASSDPHPLFFSLYLKGPPGHGKSSLVYSAASRLASMLGLNFHERAMADQSYGEKDVVVLRVELAGESTTLPINGLFDRGSYRNELKPGAAEAHVMRRIPPVLMEVARHAAVVVFLLDDVASAPDQVQNSLLGLLQHRESGGQDFGNFIPVLTGNLGAADGTRVAHGSSALTGRTRVFYVEERIEDFVVRMRNKYADACGTGYVGEYLEAYPTDFDVPPDRAADPGRPRPTPRTWEGVIDGVRQKLRRRLRGGKAAPAGTSLYEDVYLATAPLVGVEVAGRFAHYVEEMTSTALPLARNLVQAIIADAKDLDARVAEVQEQILRPGPQDPKARIFQQSFAIACADVVAARIAMTDITDESKLTHLVSALFGALLAPGLLTLDPSAQGARLNDVAISHGSVTFRSRLLNVPGLTIPSHGSAIPDLAPTFRPLMLAGLKASVSYLKSRYKTAFSMPSEHRLKTMLIDPIRGADPTLLDDASVTSYFRTLATEQKAAQG